MDLEHGRRRSILNDVRLCEQLAQNYSGLAVGTRHSVREPFGLAIEFLSLSLELLF